jgi:hypothetical protein
MIRPGLDPVTFVAGTTGAWAIDRVTAIVGPPLPAAARLEIHRPNATADGAWSLKGVAGQVRYVEAREKGDLNALSPPLGRTEATQGALIPIRKSVEWWSLAQDERRAIFEDHSRHIAGSMKYLPRIARRLFHARDLGEPFDFLTWFEFAPEHASAFDDLLATLRASEEWKYVDHEVDVRVSR